MSASNLQLQKNKRCYSLIKIQLIRLGTTVLKHVDSFTVTFKPCTSDGIRGFLAQHVPVLVINDFYRCLESIDVKVAREANNRNLWQLFKIKKKS